MDPAKNPFAPNAGREPPELAGRTDVLDRIDLALRRTKDGRSAKNLVLVGLRGVGKTVLLNRAEAASEGHGYRCVVVECVDAKRLDMQLLPKLRKLLLQLDKVAGTREKVKSALRTFQSFLSVIKIKHGDLELSISAAKEPGVADTGDIENDLPDLIEAVADAAADCQSAVCLIFDEMQYLEKSELSALIMAMHRCSQKKLPAILIGAGLPPLLGHMGNSKSYAERLFDFPSIGPLDRKGVEQAVQIPIEAAKAFIERRAIDHIYTATQGYPFFVQQWAYEAWNCAIGMNVELRYAQNADTEARKRLDESFFSVRFNRVSLAEKEYLRAIAFFPTDVVRSSKVAEVLGKSPQSANGLRASLTKKGMIYSPSLGDVSFTVPMFGGFMRRVVPNWAPKNSS